jgi:hypothetical protein
MTQGESQRVWQAGMALCSEIVAAAGDAEGAAVLVGAQEPFADLPVYTGPSVWHRTWGWPYRIARTENNWAALLEGRPGRRSEAELWARSAVAAGEHLGNDWLVERALLVSDAAASDHRGAAEGGV